MRNAQRREEKKIFKINVFLHLLSILSSSASNTQCSTAGGKLLTCSAPPDVFSVYGYGQLLDQVFLETVPFGNKGEGESKEHWGESQLEECRLEGGGRCSMTYIFLLR